LEDALPHLYFAVDRTDQRVVQKVLQGGGGKEKTCGGEKKREKGKGGGTGEKGWLLPKSAVSLFPSLVAFIENGGGNEGRKKKRGNFRKKEKRRGKGG